MASSEYQQYKKEHQNPRSYVARHTGKITFTVINTEWHRPSKYNMTIDEMVHYVHKEYKHKRIVYSNLDSPFLAAFHKIGYPNLVILSAAKNNMKYLEEGLPEYIRPIEELYVPDNKVLIKFKTAQFIKSQNGVEFDYYPVMPDYCNDRFNKLKNYFVKYDIYRNQGGYCYTDAHVLLDIIPEDSFDLYALGEFMELKPYLMLSYRITHCLSLCGGNPELEYYLLMKAKKIRPCYRYYKKIRERVTNILKSL
jgi:hypothetical protein